MKRINITYGGIDYTIAHAELEAVEETIRQAVASGEPTWLRVNHGEGSYRETDLLLAPGIPIAVSGVDAD